MIPRYSRDEMASIWMEDTKFSIWLDIEIYALEAMEEIGIVPKGVSELVRRKAKFDIKKIISPERPLLTKPAE